MSLIQNPKTKKWTSFAGVTLSEPEMLGLKSFSAILSLPDLTLLPSEDSL